MNEYLVFGVVAVVMVAGCFSIVLLMLAAIFHVTRFSLRNLLVVMTVISAVMGIVAALIRAAK
jgi:hypothetical protein